MKIMIITAYDGTNYCGSQIQPDKPTIEGKLNEALSELTKAEVKVTGASRTDAGVHSYGNVYTFDTFSHIPVEKFPLALNTIVPPDIRVMSAKEVRDDFHPRHGVIDKTYEYHLDDGFIEIPTKRLYSYHVRHRLDIDKMNEAAKYLIGEHDFTSFCSAKTEKESKVRTIFDLNVKTAGEQIYDNRDVIITVRGNGFLYNMVRIIAGTLMNIGTGKTDPNEIIAILEKKDRAAAGPTLPPNGLFLMEIRYDI